MNKLQKFVIILGIAILILSGIFPPWHHVYKGDHGLIQGKTFYHSIIINPPYSRGDLVDKIDYFRFLMQSLIIIVLVVALVLLLKKIKTPKLSMKLKRKIVVLIGASLFLLMGIFPPWYGTSKNKQYTSGYYCLFISPTSSSWKYRIDGSRLCLQWILVVVATGGIVFLLKDKGNDNEK